MSTQIAASGHQEKTSLSHDVIILIPVIGKGSINDNNLGESHLCFSFPACVPGCVLLWQEAGGAYLNVLFCHYHYCSSSLQGLFLGLLFGLPNQSSRLSSTYLSATSALVFGWSLEGKSHPTTTPCRPRHVTQAALLPNSSRVISQRFTICLHILQFFCAVSCTIFTMLSLLFYLNILLF